MPETATITDHPAIDIDHVLVGVSDPAATAARLRKQHGFGAIPGGLHPGGTGNWLVPLEPPQYLELLYVADRDSVAANPDDAGLLAMDLSLEPLLAWALRTDDIDAVGRRLGLVSQPGSITAAGGRSSSWRTVSDPEFWSGARPFFIQYDDPDNRRPAWWSESYRRAAHDVEVGGFAWIEVAADADALRRWTGDDNERLRCVPGVHGLRRAAISTSRGELIVGARAHGNE